MPDRSPASTRTSTRPALILIPGLLCDELVWKNQIEAFAATHEVIVPTLDGFDSIADMAAWPWVLPDLQGQDIDEFPNLRGWMRRVGDRPAVRKGRAAGEDLRRNLAAGGKAAEDARKLLFGQRARRS